MSRLAVSATPDLLDIVEVGYRVELSAQEWLEQLAHTVRPHLDEGFGLAAFEFFRPEGAAPQLLQSRHFGIPEQLAEIYPKVFETMDPEIRLRPFQMGPCVTGSQMMGMREEFREQPHMRAHVHRFGMFDSIWITAVEPGGHGCGFHAGRAKIRWATPSQSRRWGRIAAHLSTALRLRQRLAATGGAVPDAVLDPTGKVQDASGEAKTKQAREQLRRAVVALEEARGPLRSSGPDQSLAGWRALVSGRWSLLDQVDHDGRRYLVARQNEPEARGPAALTVREKQVLGYAKLGHHNKLIAYELGIADSTVRVLIARAAAKLGVGSRAALLRLLSSARAAGG